MRRFRFSPRIQAPLALFRHDGVLKSHPDYRRAKAGDAAAAVRLVTEFAEPLGRDAARCFAGPVIYVAAHAREASGDNAIPQILAEAIANAAAARVFWRRPND